MPPELSCQNLTCTRKEWNSGLPSRVAGVTASFPAGRLYGFMGPDGCGKGLLLNLLGLLERPDDGEVRLDGVSAGSHDAPELVDLRNRVFGFLFVQRALLPAFSLAENVAMPLFRICGTDPVEARDRTLEALDFCGIAGNCDDLAGRSGAGTQDRAALARALVHGPRFLVAISPHGEDELLPLARRAVDERGMTVLWAGSSPELPGMADAVFHLREGRVIRET